MVNTRVYYTLNQLRQPPGLYTSVVP
jgi:hypothetical protein